MTYGETFCSQHRSFFCPCVGPWIYEDGEAALVEWDAKPDFGEVDEDFQHDPDEALPLLSERLPELLDARHLANELGVSRAAAEKMMRLLPLVEVPGLRKVYVKRSDVAALLEASTVESGRLDRAGWPL